MKRNLYPIIFFLLSFSLIQAQLVESSWSFGFGGAYPRLMNHNRASSSGTSYMGFVNFQRNFTEEVGLRIQPSYAHISYDNHISSNRYTDIISLDLDFIYYIAPCKSITPYLLLGGGPLMYMLTEPEAEFTDDYYFTGKINFGAGFEWKLGRDWSMNLELDYNTSFTDDLDGRSGSGNGGILTNEFESYMTAVLGCKYYFS